MSDLRVTDHGVAIEAMPDTPIYVDVLYSDSSHGTWLLLSTDHDAVEVRVSPAGRKVRADDSHLRHRRIAGEETP